MVRPSDRRISLSQNNPSLGNGASETPPQYRRMRPTSRPWIRTRSGPKMRVS